MYAGLEDFGIAPVEAMAAGAPVIGYGAGGLCDSVRCHAQGASHPTGLLFGEQSAACLAAALEHFESSRLWQALPAEAQRLWADNFSPERFEQRLLPLLEQLWQGHQRRLRQARSPDDLDGRLA